MSSCIRAIFFVLCTFLLCSCATYNPPALHFGNLGRGVIETKDSISVCIKPMSETENKDFFGDLFAGEMQAAYIEVQNASAFTIRYTGDGFMNNALDDHFKKTYSRQSMWITGASGVSAVLLGILGMKNSDAVGYSLLGGSISLLLYNEIVEGKQIEFYKTHNLNNLYNRELLPGESKQLLLYFGKDNNISSAKIRFVKRGIEQPVRFGLSAGNVNGK